MEPIALFHNPKAGDSNHQPESLKKLIEKQGFACQYNSVKSDDWQKFDENARFVVGAGGDGCVRRVIGMLLNRTLMQKQYPLAIIPLGTANNISKTLGIPQNPDDAIAAFPTLKPQRLDIGILEGLEETDFFVEGVGVGVFPGLMKEMQKIDREAASVEDRLEATLRVMEKVVGDFRPLKVTVTVGGDRYEDEYLMVEVMNTKFVGPNLALAEKADPGDGQLELILIPAGERIKLMEHIRAHFSGVDDGFSYPSLKVDGLVLSVPPATLHVDDQIVNYPGGELRVGLRKGILEVLVPQER